MSKGRLVSLALVLLATAACDSGGSTGPASPSMSPSAQAWSSAGTLAIYDGVAANGSSHTVWVVGFNNAGAANATAKIVATVTLKARARIAYKIACLACPGPTDPPYVGMSNSHVYVLDGDATVRMLAPDGSLTKVTSIPGTPTARAAFAVSPDDTQIAVGVIDLASQSAKLYIEKLAGGGRVDVLTGSGPQLFWPIGWRNGKIVLATGTNTSTFLNPYSASRYALIDPTAGAQPVALGKGDCVPSGTLTEAGTACIVRPGTQCLEDLVANAASPYYYNTCLRRVSWTGSETTFLLPNNAYTSSFTVSSAALSPDGLAIMTDQRGRVLAPVSDTHGGNEFLGSYTIRLPSDVGMGWIGNELFSMTTVNLDGISQSIVALNPPDYNAIRNVPFEGTAPIVGRLLGTLPGGL